MWIYVTNKKILQHITHSIKSRNLYYNQLNASMTLKTWLKNLNILGE